MRLLILAAVLGLALAEKVRYDGYQMWEIGVNSAADAHLVMSLYDQGLIRTVEGALRKSGMATIIVGPKHTRLVAAQLRKHDIAFSTSVEDLQKEIDAETARLAARSRTGAMAYDPSNYNSLDDNYDHMNDMIQNCPSGLSCSVDSAGDSYEGRPINIYKLSTGANKPIVWIDSCIHAREWLACTTAIRIFDFIIEEYRQDNEEVTDMLSRYDFWILPIGNPDGYSYTWTSDRMWRGNRRPIPGTNTIGVDLNRNFDYNWCRQGASSTPGSETFCGTAPASEPETQAYQNAISAVADRMATLITLHTYGQMWMHPWGNTEDFGFFSPCERANDHEDMLEAAEAAAEGIFQESGRRWDYGTSCEVIYATTGATDDWAKGVAGVKYCFNPELRSFFTAPTSEIEPSFREVWRAVVFQMAKIEEIEGPGFPL